MKSPTALLSQLLAIAATASLGAAAPAHADLLNGSFEGGTFTNQGNDTETFSAGATTMTGWTTTGDVVSWIGPTNPFGIQAEDGSYFLDLTGYHAGAPFGGVSQSVTTTAGQGYELSFYLGSYTAVWGGPPVSILASAGGTSQTFTNAATTATSTWTAEHFFFTATGSATTITLTGAAGLNYIGLDNVSLASAVPEPSLFSLIGAGSLFLTLVGVRKLRGIGDKPRLALRRVAPSTIEFRR